MHQRHGHDLHTGEAEGSGNAEQRQLRQSAARLNRRIERVRKHAAEARHRRGIRVAADRRPLHLVEAPDVVQAEHMIRVVVREQDRIDAADVALQRLRAQVGRRVDQDRQAVHLDQDRRPGAAVARIG